MLSAKIWKSEKSFKVLKDEKLLEPVSGNKEKAYAHTSSLPFHHCLKFYLVYLVPWPIFFLLFLMFPFLHYFFK